MGRPQELSREYLESVGITEITSDGKHVYRNGYELALIPAVKKYKNGNRKEYYLFTIYDTDVYKVNRQKVEQSIDAKGNRAIVLSRAVYAWYKGLAPANLDVDHIDNDSLNNDISNLQLLTRSENIKKQKLDRLNKLKNV